MLKTIDRYVFKECAWSSLGVIMVLLVILLGNTLVRVLGDIADGKLPTDTLGAMLGINLIHYLVVLLPIGVYLGILLGMGRLYRDSEMAAMLACGVGSRRLYRGVTALVVPATLLTLMLSMLLAPWTAGKKASIQHDAKYGSQLGGLTAGQFTITAKGRQTLFFENWSDDKKEIEKVFLQNKKHDNNIIQTAESADIQERDQGHYIVFKDGQSYNGEPGRKNYQVVDFKKHGVLIEQDQIPLLKLKTSATPTWLLFTEQTAIMRAEWHWRMAIPIACLLLALIALPLSHTAPRKGRFSKVGVGLLVYIIYSNMLGLGRAWIEHDSVPVWLGLWWAHALMLAALILVIILREKLVLFSSRKAAT